MITVVLATKNRHKFRELAALLRVRGIQWRSLAEFPLVGEIQERGRTFRANAVHKARAVAKATGCLALADDSGLEVDALGGAPGVRSARFAGRHGADRTNNAKLARVLRTVPTARRGAAYRCVLALAGPRGLLAVTEGAWRGRMARAPQGAGGFGYDPLFWVPRLRKTAAQLSAPAKNRMSHRGRAARRMRAALQRLVSERTPATARSRWGRAG